MHAPLRMKEELLHYIWEHQKLATAGLRTTGGEEIVIHDPGRYNQGSGPDFFYARIDISGQSWAGNVEIHRKSSDWYVHRHEQDDHYDNIILHVVWEDDLAVFRKDNTPIPALELKNAIPSRLLENYRLLFANRVRKFINCEKRVGNTDPVLITGWLERLYFERLEHRSAMIRDLLKELGNDWEWVLFALLLKGFGSKINGAAFYSLGKAVDYRIFRRIRSSRIQTEALLFGMGGLLNDPKIVDAYYLDLRKEYAYLRVKFNLNEIPVTCPEFFRLRPSNFPTIRLSQVSAVYQRHQHLFSKLIETNSPVAFYDLFNVTANSYWNDHFSFGKFSGKRVKRLSPRFIDLLLINTVLPLKFCYARERGTTAVDEILPIIMALGCEKNAVVDRFGRLGVPGRDAMEGQAMLQLYTNYCTRNKCLHCAIGVHILNGK